MALTLAESIPQNDDRRKGDQKQLTAEGGESECDQVLLLSSTVCVVVNYQSSSHK